MGVNSVNNTESNLLRESYESLRAENADLRERLAACEKAPYAIGAQEPIGTVVMSRGLHVVNIDAERVPNGTHSLYLAALSSKGGKP